MSSCNVCAEINRDFARLPLGAYSELIRQQKTHIYSTRNFVVIPSIGALNKTHVLIVPKIHMLSFADIPNEAVDELLEIKKAIKDYSLRIKNNKIIIFEHGTGKNNNSSGACVEHAHLHVVCEISGFGNELLSSANMIPIRSYTSFQNKADKENGYIYFENSKGDSWFSNNPEVPSQFFRFLYSKYQDDSIEWNWKKSSRIEVIKESIDYYKDIKSYT